MGKVSLGIQIPNVQLALTALLTVFQQVQDIRSFFCKQAARQNHKLQPKLRMQVNLRLHGYSDLNLAL